MLIVGIGGRATRYGDLRWVSGVDLVSFGDWVKVVREVEELEMLFRILVWRFGRW